MQSLIEWSKLPEEFGLTVLLLSLVLFISPYFAGSDFGFLKVPAFKPSVRQRLYIVGPLLLALSIGAHVPILEVKSTGQGVTENPPPPPPDAPETPPETTEDDTPPPNPPRPEPPVTNVTVEMIQIELLRLGVYTGAVDGEYGPGTVAGVRQVQQYLGDRVTGTLQDARQIYARMRAIQDPIVAAGCTLTLENAPAVVHATPNWQSTETGRASPGDYRVLDKRLVRWVNSRDWWFKINAGRVTGWVQFMPLRMSMSGTECPT